MLKDLIILPDGTELFSGKVGENAIFDSTFTECVNSGEDLTLGSTCANMLEVTIWNPGSRLKINAGDELTLYKVDKTGERHKIGIFLAEKPERPSDNIMRLTCYDRIIKLDVDLTDWLLGLTGWPYTLLEFAGMVCKKCGLNFITTEVTNGDFPIYAYTKQGTTGRKLMQWLGEIAASFCRADKDGNVEFGAYRITTKMITPTGTYKGQFENVVDVVSHYYQNSLTYSDYEVTGVDSVQVKLGDLMYPSVDSGKNVYVIADNPFLYSAALYGATDKEPDEPEEPQQPEKIVVGNYLNGKKFPALPDRNKSKYPYAVVLEYTPKAMYDLYYTDKQIIVTDDELILEEIFYTSYNNYKKNEWGDEIEITKFPTTTIAKRPYSKIIWSETDIYKDGELFMKGSEPVPIYEEKEEEPETPDTPQEPEEEKVLNPQFLEPYLENIKWYVNFLSKFSPCKVTIPTQLEIRAGDIFYVAYPNDPEYYFPTRCMIRTQKNQRDTLEATDSQRLDSVSAQYSGSGSGSSASSQISNTALKVVSTGQNVSMSINGGILTMTHNDEKVLEVKATDTVEAAILALKDALLAATGNLSIYAKGNLSIGCDGEFSLGNHLMSWKDNGDGTFTPIGTPKQ